ncbi:MAG TPA: RDD family protein [Microthrixaceae bacterium]|nr:RDD family protein [Microthrixaceae bacterium]
MHAGTVTPEAVLLELPTAGVATRAFARLVDLAVQLVAASVLGTVLGFALPAGVSPVLMALVLMVAVLLVLPIAMEVASNGRSVGKAMFGLRAVGADGSPVTTRQSMVRGVVGLVDFYLSLGFLATVTAMFSTTSQRSGDMAAGTVVIRSRTDPAAAVPIAFHPPVGYEHYVSTLDVGALDEEDFSLVRSFLLRVDQLQGDARRSIALGLAEGVRVRIAHTPPAVIDPELFLVCVASAFQLRQGGLLADAALGLAPLAPIGPAPASSPGRAARHRGR